MTLRQRPAVCFACYAAVMLCLLGAAHRMAAQAGDISGKWVFAFTMGEYFAEYPADLRTEGEKVAGTLAGQPVDGTFKDGALALKFPFHPPEAPAPSTLVIDAQLEGNALSGQFTFGEYAGTMRGTRTR